MYPIDRITLTHVRIPLRDPFRISCGEIRETDAIVVRIDADGITGWGQSSPAPAGFGYSDETPETCWSELAGRLVPAALGIRGIDPSTLHQQLAPLAQPFAIAGIESAVWDGVAKARGEPLYRLLGGTSAEVPCGLVASLRESTAATVEWIARYLDEGYRRIKIKIAPACDLPLVRAVRAAFPDATLQVDANASYRMEHLSVFEAMDELGLAMIEQPLAAAALEEHAVLARRIRTPICLDESLVDIDALDRALVSNRALIANLKVQRLGGLQPARAMHDACVAHGVPAWVGCMPELGIGLAHGLALATLRGCHFPTDIQPVEPYFTDDIIEPRIVMSREGTLAIPDTPGIGFEVDEARLARYRVRETVFTR